MQSERDPDRITDRGRDVLIAYGTFILQNMAYLRPAAGIIINFDIETFPTLYLYQFYCIIAGCGEVSEWLMVPLSKSGLAVSASAGSNPALSAR
jgi:hypothetical protein